MNFFFFTFLEKLLKQQSDSSYVAHYLNDFFLAGMSGTQDCVSSVSFNWAFSAELGVPLAEERTLGPSTCLVYLGLEISIILFIC